MFLQDLSGFRRIDVKSDKSYFVEMMAIDFKMIAIDKDTIVVCSEYYAKFIELNK